MAALVGGAIAMALLPPATQAVGGRAAVIDGDSLRVEGTQIRLRGIDAPEFDQTCADAHGRDWPCGRRARTGLADMVAGHRVECTGRGHDRYGRLLAICHAGEVDIAAALVEAGLAVTNGEHAREQGRARDARRGLWQGAFEDPADWRRKSAQQPRNTGAPGWFDALWGN